MTTIQVDPDQLRLASEQYAAMAQRLLRLQWDVEQAADGAPSYDGQFGPQVQSMQAEAAASVQRVLSQMVEAGEYLAQKAEGFASADAAAQDGFYQLALAIRATVDQFAGLSTLPRWMLLGQRPPWVDPEEWRHMPGDDRQAMLEGYRWQWAQFLAGRTEGSFRPSQGGLPYLEEMFGIYLFGLPASLFDARTGQQIEPYVPPESSYLFLLPTLLLATDYGRPDLNRRQYQDLGIYVEELSVSPNPDDVSLAQRVRAVQTRRWASSHYNLCGLDAVGYAVGARDMMEVYMTFAGVNEEMLITNDTTWTYEIRDLYREMGWEAEQIGRFASTKDTVWLHWDEENRLAFPTFENVKGKLAEGYAITPLVGVDAARGTLSANPDAAVGHFVTISETIVTQDGTQLIRVYNSLEHREEIYTWEWFDEIWQKAGGNSGGQAAIARPPVLGP